MRRRDFLSVKPIELLGRAAGWLRKKRHLFGKVKLLNLYSMTLSELLRVSFQGFLAVSGVSQ